MDTIAIFRKGELNVDEFTKAKGRKLPKDKVKAIVDGHIENMVDDGKIRIIRRSVIHAMLDGTFSNLPLVSQHEIDKTNGPRKLMADGKGWEVPASELGRKQEATDSTVISIKRYLQNSLGIDPAIFSVCRIHGRSAIELGE